VATGGPAYDAKVMRAACRLFVSTLLCLLASASGPAAAWAAPEDAVPLEAEGQQQAAPVPATRVTCLDDLSPEGNQRKGVQKRDFLKRHKLEMSALGGLYASDALSSTYTVGAALAFFLGEDFGLELLGAYAPARFRLEEPFVGFNQPRRFTPGPSYTLLGGLVFSPVHAKFKFSEETIVHGDLSLIVGGGRTLHDSVQGFAFQGGFGLRLFLLSRLAFRFEVRDIVLPQEVLGKGRVTNNLTVLGGFSFWLG
jgi:outer membrane beta-barrel protein